MQTVDWRGRHRGWLLLLPLLEDDVCAEMTWKTEEAKQGYLYSDCESGSAGE